MNYRAQYKRKNPPLAGEGNAYTYPIKAGTDAEAREEAAKHCKGGYRLIAVYEDKKE
jgi:hypothetical protein